jgi:hypothetical protein
LPALPRKPLAVAPAALLLLVALWEVCATRRDAHAVPGDEAWQRASAAVRHDHVPGDLIVFAPEWIDPVGRLHFGDLIPVDMAARMDAARYGTIWEVSIRDARAPETAGLEPKTSADFGGVTVRRFVREPAVVVSDVRDQLATVQGPKPSLELAEVGFAPHRCLQITPAVNDPQRITFPALQLGTTLVGYVGLADVFTRRDIRAPGELDVEIDGIIRARIEPGVDDGWVRFEIATQPGPADVTFVASATAAQREICFAAEARR